MKGLSRLGILLILGLAGCSSRHSLSTPAPTLDQPPLPALTVTAAKPLDASQLRNLMRQTGHFSRIESHLLPQRLQVNGRMLEGSAWNYPIAILSGLSLGLLPLPVQQSSELTFTLSGPDGLPQRYHYRNDSLIYWWLGSNDKPEDNVTWIIQALAADLYRDLPRPEPQAAR